MLKLQQLVSDGVHQFQIILKRSGKVILIGYYKKRIVSGKGENFELALFSFELNYHSHC